MVVMGRGIPQVSLSGPFHLYDKLQSNACIAISLLPSLYEMKSIRQDI